MGSRTRAMRRARNCLVGVDARQVDERGARRRKQRHDAVEQEVLQPRSPALAPEVLEGGDDAGGGERVALGRDVRQRIEADRPLGIGGVEIADLMGAFGRDAIRDRLGEVAVRVDDGDALAGDDVVHGQVEKRRALSRARFTHDVDVPLAFIPRETDRAPGRACDVCVR